MLACQQGKIYILILPLIFFFHCQDTDFHLVKTNFRVNGVAIGNILDDYKYFTFTEWNIDQDIYGNRIVRFSGTLHDSIFQSQLTRHFESKRQALPPDYITKKHNLKKTEDKIKERIKTVRLIIEFRVNKRKQIEIKSIYCKAKAYKPDSIENKYIEDYYSENILKLIYLNKPIQLGWTHLHKHFYY